MRSIETDGTDPSLVALSDDPTLAVSNPKKKTFLHQIENRKTQDYEVVIKRNGSPHLLHPSVQDHQAKERRVCGCASFMLSA